MDLLVKLYALPDLGTVSVSELSFRRAFAAEKIAVEDFIVKHFTRGWASECAVSFARLPVACFIATSAQMICGFACYDAAARGFFGPIGVAKEFRGRGIGHVLLLHTLHDMHTVGYAYAIVGAANDPEFYRGIGAVEIPDSDPGFYRGMLKQ